MIDKLFPLLAACILLVQGPGALADSVSYTRGVGVYPGAPADYTGPAQTRPDKHQVRNLALLRPVRASSSYDLNLTGHLVADGIVEEEQPCFLEVSTQDGPFARNSRDILIDGNPSSSVMVPNGEDAFLQMLLRNGSFSAERFSLLGTALSHSSDASAYRIVFEKCDESGQWTPFAESQGSLKGASTPLSFSCDLPAEKISGVRARFFCDDVKSWKINEFYFYDGAGKTFQPLTIGQFSSSWMSEGAGEESLEMDLGSVSRISGIRLHWINGAVEGKVLVSKNGRRWKKISTFPAEEIHRRTRARYIRLEMTKSSDGNPYVLSEIEVTGKGGVGLAPAAQPEAEGGRLFLQGGGWKLSRAGSVSASGEQISTDRFDDSSWLVATVPGTVLMSYVNAGAVPDGSHADDQLQISDSYFHSDFWYRDSFDLPAAFAGKTLTLRFDGINWKAEVFFNGVRLGNIEGAFRRGDFDVTALAREHNILAVKIFRTAHPGPATVQDKAVAGLNGGVLGADNPTYHASIGWDWIPSVRGRNIGIWNDVVLEATDGAVTIEDVDIASKLSGERSGNGPATVYSYADLTARAVLQNRSGAAREGVLKLRFDGKIYEQPCSIAAGECKEVFLPVFRVDNPRLWWPAGYGSQELYDASFCFEEGGSVSDECTVKTGIREMTYRTDGGILDIYVNGRRFVGNGGSWGFPEFNLRFRAREYDAAVAYHADMGLTLIRNWVGQTGDDEFYDACDRHGVMVWQDFWLANPVDGPDPDDEDLFLDNARDYVRKIRRHPCIAIYVGRNEGMPPAAVDEGLDRIVRQMHPGMMYIPHSAEGLVSGYGPYCAQDTPADYFTLERGFDRLHSERGMPNVMTYESMLRWAAEEDLWPKEDTDLWGMHDFTTGGHQRTVTYDTILERWFGKQASLKDYTERAQWVNYDIFRALYESRSPRRKGVLSWMSHSCWPSLVWHVYDYYFDPGAAYFGAKKGCAPIRIQWNPVDGKVEVVNHSAGDRTGLLAVARTIKYDGTILTSQEVRTDSFEDSTVQLMGLENADAGNCPVWFIQLALYEGDRLLADNFYWQSSAAGGSLSALSSLDKVRLESSLIGSDSADGGLSALVKVRNTSGTPALMIRLRLCTPDGESILPAIYSDNYFSLMGGEEKEILVRFREEDTRGGHPEVEVSGFNVVNNIVS